MFRATNINQSRESLLMMLETFRRSVWREGEVTNSCSGLLISILCPLNQSQHILKLVSLNETNFKMHLGEHELKLKKVHFVLGSLSVDIGKESVKLTFNYGCS